MPRGVYDRKNKKTSTPAAQASASGGASKAKKSWKKSAVVARSSAIDFTSFTALSTYLQQITQARHNLSQSAELDQEIKATVSNLRNIREQLFSVETAEVVAQGNENRTPTAGVAAPVPFNPPSFSGQVQQ